MTRRVMRFHFSFQTQSAASTEPNASPKKPPPPNTRSIFAAFFRHSRDKKPKPQEPVELQATQTPAHPPDQHPNPDVVRIDMSGVDTSEDEGLSTGKHCDEQTMTMTEDEEEGDGEEPRGEGVQMCRICFECVRLDDEAAVQQDRQENGPMIRPCMCSGGLSYVHQGCIKQWLVLQDISSCEICGFNFLLDRQPLPFRQVSIPVTMYTISCKKH